MEWSKLSSLEMDPEMAEIDFHIAGLCRPGFLARLLLQLLPLVINATHNIISCNAMQYILIFMLI